MHCVLWPKDITKTEIYIIMDKKIEGINVCEKDKEWGNNNNIIILTKKSIT